MYVPEGEAQRREASDPGLEREVQRRGRGGGSSGPVAARHDRGLRCGRRGLSPEEGRARDRALRGAAARRRDNRAPDDASLAGGLNVPEGKRTERVGEEFREI